MKITGSPTKRNRENAIRPTASMTRTAWAMRRRMKASISSRFYVRIAIQSALAGLRSQANRLAARARAPRPAVAGHDGPVSHLALGSDAAADAGCDGASLF